MGEARGSGINAVRSVLTLLSSHLNLIKAFGVVASVALRSEAALVNVVFPMTAAAGSRKFDLAGHGYTVTTIAG
ncbi:MAG: hypothetical protein V3S24_13785 [Candidatus Tectomicrobia bacterium]